MLNQLHKVEKDILKIIFKAQKDRINGYKNLNTMHIDYHEPFVNRIWFQYDEKHRVYLHKIFPIKQSTWAKKNVIGWSDEEIAKDKQKALFHPHPWESAIRILEGKYEMGIGHSETNEIPAVDCKLILPTYSEYEMVDENGWHYVSPLSKPSYSIMVTGNLNEREMPVEPNKKFRKLMPQEAHSILETVRKVYNGRKILRLF